MNQQKNTQDFKVIVTMYIKREGIDDLMAWLENSDFFSAPASTRFHGSETGGLCKHSINVFQQLDRVASLFAPDKYSREALAIVALFHDLCKVDCYKPGFRNVKDDKTGQWSRVPTFNWEEQQCFGGHGSKSLFLVTQFMKLSFEEAAAINSHMGFSDQSNINAVSSCYEQNLLAWMLHVADEAATYIDKV